MVAALTKGLPVPYAALQGPRKAIFDYTSPTTIHKRAQDIAERMETVDKDHRCFQGFKVIDMILSDGNGKAIRIEMQRAGEESNVR